MPDNIPMLQTLAHLKQIMALLETIATVGTNENMKVKIRHDMAEIFQTLLKQMNEDIGDNTSEIRNIKRDTSTRSG